MGKGREEVGWEQEKARKLLEMRRLWSTRNGIWGVYAGIYAHRKYWWACPICLHEWESTPRAMKKAGYECPECADGRNLMGKYINA